MDKHERFCHHFAKEDNFCRQEVASVAVETISKWGLLLKERICSQREQIPSFKSSPNEKAGKHFHARVISLGNVSILLKYFQVT